LILPQLEQTNLSQSLSVGQVPLHVNAATPAGLALLRTPLPMYRCPSDIGPVLNNYVSPAPASNWYNMNITNGSGAVPIATSNYILVSGTGVSTTPAANPSNRAASACGPMGIGFRNSKINMRDITDGSSNTLLVGERAWKYSQITVGAGVALGFSASINDQSSSANIKSAAMAAIGLGYNGINWSASNQVHQTRGFSSAHTGGAQFVLCDGSVRLISENIDYKSTDNAALTDMSLPRRRLPVCLFEKTARSLANSDGPCFGAPRPGKSGHVPPGRPGGVCRGCCPSNWFTCFRTLKSKGP
jgi:prepilin-type processing-associated H-X9-DG protein